MKKRLKRGIEREMLVPNFRHDLSEWNCREMFRFSNSPVKGCGNGPMQALMMIFKYNYSFWKMGKIVLCNLAICFFLGGATIWSGLSHPPLALLQVDSATRSKLLAAKAAKGSKERKKWQKQRQVRDGLGATMGACGRDLVWELQ